MFLIFEKMFFKKILDNNRIKLLNNIYVMLVVIIGWVLFRANSLHNAIDLIKLMFSFSFKETYILMPTYFNIKSILIILIAIISCGPAYCILKKLNIKNKLSFFYEKNLEVLCLFLIMFICILELTAGTYNPFIYFRF